MRARGSAMCTAPTTTRRGAGWKGCTKITPSAASRRIAWSRASASRMAAITSAPSGSSPSLDAAVTRRCAPLPRCVASATGVFAARAASSRSSVSARNSVDPLDEDLDPAAAGEPDLPGVLVADAELEQTRTAVRDRLQRFLDHRALDAAAGDRADEAAVGVDRELTADGARRRAPRSRRRSRAPRACRRGASGRRSRACRRARRRDRRACAAPPRRVSRGARGQDRAPGAGRASRRVPRPVERGAGSSSGAIHWMR